MKKHPLKVLIIKKKFPFQTTFSHNNHHSSMFFRGYQKKAFMDQIPIIQSKPPLASRNPPVFGTSSPSLSTILKSHLPSSTLHISPVLVPGALIRLPASCLMAPGDRTPSNACRGLSLSLSKKKKKTRLWA